jgi:hypothetical protein
MSNLIYSAPLTSEMVEYVRDSSGIFHTVLKGQRCYRQNAKTVLITSSAAATQFDGSTKISFQVPQFFGGLDHIEKAYVKMILTNTTANPIQISPAFQHYRLIQLYYNASNIMSNSTPYSLMCDYSILPKDEFELNAQMCGYIGNPATTFISTVANYNINEQAPFSVRPDWIIPAAGTLETYCRIDLGKFLTSHLFCPGLINNQFMVDAYVNSVNLIGGVNQTDISINSCELVLQGIEYSNKLSQYVKNVLADKTVSIPSIYEVSTTNAFNNGSFTSGSQIQVSLPGFNGVFESLQFSLIQANPSSVNAYSLCNNGTMVVAANGVGTYTAPLPIPSQPFADPYIFNGIQIFLDGSSNYFSKPLTYKQLYDLEVSTTAFTSRNIERDEGTLASAIQNIGHLQMIPFSNSVTEDVLTHNFGGGLAMVTSSTQLQVTPTSTLSGANFTLAAYGRRACVTKINYSTGEVSFEYVPQV